jgi:S1-C subfamily serine protease
MVVHRDNVRKNMHRGIVVLSIISVILASLLAIQVLRDGDLAAAQLNTKPTAVQSIQPPNSNNNNNNQRSGNTATNGNNPQNIAASSNIGNLSNFNIGNNITGNASTILDAQSAVFNHIFKNVENSVVQITTTVNAAVPNIIINGNPLRSQSTRLGSGFLFDATKVLIITNNHVVDGAKSVDVTFVDGNTYSAKVIGTDAFSDIAVLQITDNFSSEHFIPLQFGNSSQLEVGQQVIAIGNPFGLSDTMTNGIISQVGRLLPNQDMGFSIPNVIQTNAAINPGNSGGPLLDLRGNVIGVNSAISSQTGEFAGIGFAIPSDTVARIVPHLIKDGKYDHPWLGIAGADLTPDLAQQLRLPRDTKGVVIAQVTPGSPADKAGIIGKVQNDGTTPSGDIITAMDGHQVKRIEDLISYIEENKSVGDTVVVTVLRDGQSHNLTLTLQSRPLPTVQQTGG